MIRDARAEIDRSIIAEALARLAGMRIQSEETRIDRGIEDALVHTIRRATTGERRASLPVGSTSILQGTSSAYVAGKGIEYPDFLPGFCLQGNHAAGGRGEVKHPSTIKGVVSNAAIGPPRWMELQLISPV